MKAGFTPCMAQTLLLLHKPDNPWCLAQGGDLRHAFSADQEDRYSWYASGKGVALDIARGLHFLHNMGVIHR